MIIAWIIAETAGIVDVVLGFFTRGGLFMWPLLTCSIVSVTIMILRGLALRRKIVMPSAIEAEIERMAPGESPEPKAYLSLRSGHGRHRSRLLRR